jgi:general secretion pathway protein N
MMQRRIWIAAALLAFILIVATLPMRLALVLAGARDAGLSARAVTGSIWSGQLVDARWRGARLGTLGAGLAPLALLGGEARLNIARDDVLLGKLDGVLILNGARGVADMNGTVSLGASLAGVPLDTLRLAAVTTRFDDDGRCVEAAGQAQLSIALPVPGLDLANGLSGPLTCRAGRAEAALASQSGMERLTLAVDGAGAYRARLSVRASSDAAVTGLLRAAGFLPAGGELVLLHEGRL